MATKATWSKICESEKIQRSSQTLAVVDHKVYIFGGELRPREPVESPVYRILIDQGKNFKAVEAVEAMTSGNTPQARVGAASTVLNGKIYVFSGRGGVSMAPIEEMGALWVFDTAGMSWSQTHPKDAEALYPVGRSYHAMTHDGNRTIFVHAGCPEKGRLRDLWAFDTVTRIWHEMPAAPAPERGGTSITYADGNLYRMNGFDGKTEQGGVLDTFNLETRLWQTIKFDSNGSFGPSPRSVGCLLSLVVYQQPTLITMFGEHDPSNLGHQGAGKMLGDIWLFDIRSQKWSELKLDGESERPCPRGWFDADVVGETQLVIHGGLAASNERLGDVWFLNLGPSV